MHTVKLENTDSSLPFSHLTAPEGFHLLYYGFGATLFAMNTLAKGQLGESIDPFYINRLADLAKHTDQDWSICPIDKEIKNLDDSPAALAVFHQMENAINPGKKTIPYWDMRYAPPLYIQSANEHFDCSYQRKPLTQKILEMSCQVFFNAEKQSFIFKDEQCYQLFIKRIIHTPNLTAIIDSAIQALPKTKHPDFTKLIIILRNIIKMRFIGWTLHQQDIHLILNKLENNPHVAPVIVNHLIDIQGKYPFIQALKNEISPTATIWDCFSKPLKTDAIQYIRYESSMSENEIIESMDYLEAKPLLSQTKKNEIISAFLKDIFSDKNRSKEFKNNFSEKIKSKYASNHPEILKWVKNTEKSTNDSPVIQPQKNEKTVLFSRRKIYTKQSFASKKFKELPSYPDKKATEDNNNQSSFPLFTKLHETSNERFFFFVFGMALIPFHAFHVHQRTRQDMLAHFIIYIIASTFYLYALEMLSQWTYLLLHSKSLAKIRVTIAWDKVDQQLLSPVKDNEAEILSHMAYAIELSMMYQQHCNPMDSILEEFDLKKCKTANISLMLRETEDLSLHEATIIEFIFKFCFLYNLTIKNMTVKLIEEPASPRVLQDKIFNKLLSELERAYLEIQHHIRAEKNITQETHEIFERYTDVFLKLLTLQCTTIPIHQPLRALQAFIVNEKRSPTRTALSVYHLYNRPWQIFCQNQESLGKLAEDLSEINDQSPNMSYDHNRPT